jgi:5-methylcytosine-specific restriction endonuclease McrA
MTEAAYVSFVKGHLRRASRWWKPITDTIKNARVRKGIYLCNGCRQEVTASIVIDGKRVKNVFCDHINPVVDPTTGFSGWDNFVNNLFCEPENLQLLCKECHDLKSKEERMIAQQSKKEKE